MADKLTPHGAIVLPDGSIAQPRFIGRTQNPASGPSNPGNGRPWVTGGGGMFITDLTPGLLVIVDVSLSGFVTVAGHGVFGVRIRNLDTGVIEDFVVTNLYFNNANEHHLVLPVTLRFIAADDTYIIEVNSDSGGSGLTSSIDANDWIGASILEIPIPA